MGCAVFVSLPYHQVLAPIAQKMVAYLGKPPHAERVLDLSSNKAWSWMVASTQKDTTITSSRAVGLGIQTAMGGEEENLDVELERDASVGIDAFQRFQKADWWNWSHRSALIFWRWPEGEQQKYAQDGMEVYIKRPLPRYH
jgi:hypothetical protein